jgi:hypothetical protein
MKIRIQKISAILLLVLYSGVLVNSSLHTHKYSFVSFASYTASENSANHSDPYLDSNKNCSLAVFASSGYFSSQYEDSESIISLATSVIIFDDAIIQNYKGFSPQLRAPPIS